MRTESSVMVALSELGRIEHERIAEEARSEVRSAAEARLFASEQRAERELERQLQAQATRLRAEHAQALGAVEAQLEAMRAELAVARAAEAAQRQALATVTEQRAVAPAPMQGWRLLSTVVASVLLATASAALVSRWLVPAAPVHAAPAAQAPAAIATPAVVAVPSQPRLTQLPPEPAPGPAPLAVERASDSATQAARRMRQSGSGTQPRSEIDRRTRNVPEEVRRRGGRLDPLIDIDECGDDPTCGVMSP